MKYPPFCDIIMIGINGTDENHVQNISNKIYKLLSKYNNSENIKINTFKPMPAPIDKIKNKFRWRIIAKCNLSNNILEIIKQATDLKLSNKDTRVVVDVNPVNMM